MKYKIEISEITEREEPETQYTNTNKKDEKGDAIYEYVPTGRTRIEKDEKEVYAQELEDLNVGDLACYINRIK